MKSEAYDASMKSDLRNLVTAEEAYFADSVKYSSRVACANPPSANLPKRKSAKRAGGVQNRAERGSVAFCATAGNVLGVVTVGSDTQGWSANIKNAKTPDTCAIYVGAVTPLAPATKNDPEGAPVCS